MSTQDKAANRMRLAALYNAGWSDKEAGAAYRPGEALDEWLASTQQAEPSCSWPIQPLALVQVSINGISQMAQPERPYFSAHAMQELEGRKAEPAQAAVPAPKADPVAEFRGRRQTPEGTVEFWGVMLCDPMQDPPKGSKLYAGPINDPVPRDWRSVIPGGRFTDKWESARIADFNEGWNAYRKAVIAALAAQPKEQAELPVQVAIDKAKVAMGYSSSFDGKGIDWQNGEPWPHRIELAQALDWITDLGAVILNLASRVVPPIVMAESAAVTHPAPAQAPLTREQEIAIKEGERIAASDRYFGARTYMLDTAANRRLFEAGFDAAWGVKLDKEQAR
jgi:hypothetical protein